MNVDFSKADFDELNRLRVSGMLCESPAAELYWLHVIDYKDAPVMQSLKRHHHDFFEIHFILSGSIVYDTESGIIEVPRSSYIIFPPHTPHGIEHYSTDLLKYSISIKLSEERVLWENPDKLSMDANRLPMNEGRKS